MPLLSEPPTGAGMTPDFDLAADDPYAVLGVPSSATWDEIVAAHRSLARRFHPDRVATLAEGTGDDLVTGAGDQIMAKINGAYRELRVRRGK